ncbi:nitroreductase family deazaflavin-dependent oxidoreductase [Nonomuraea mesophila]|uniref:Nitroreductase family deazaflavin-dependent oxidoreductase n=1 Tax=Nonomuraea mesophila TaxID=2530382 RepID=A0A4V2Z7W7_9ACTN|nr:nitroreductase family deazaflavin-dependent oxidoreductase [Nonomuraea mesophila]TDE38076.1 nitroreductase family deazaflavin-dependent oxidoreductase [Nonomuraea mesophila]
MSTRRRGSRSAGLAVVRGISAFKRWSYRGDRPNTFMRLVNRLDAVLYRFGWSAPRQGAVLTVVGRRSGKPTPVPVAIAQHEGAGYLVSMLGPDANWVRNVRAAGGQAVLLRRGREIPVTLEEIPPEHRAEILRRYLAIAPGARPHLGLQPTAPLERFRRIAHRHPVFRIVETRFRPGGRRRTR